MRHEVLVEILPGIVLFQIGVPEGVEDDLVQQFPGHLTPAAMGQLDGIG